MHVECNRLHLKRFKFIISTFFFHFNIACTKRRYFETGEERFKTECEIRWPDCYESYLNVYIWLAYAIGLHFVEILTEGALNCHTLLVGTVQ